MFFGDPKISPHIVKLKNHLSTSVYGVRHLSTFELNSFPATHRTAVFILRAGSRLITECGVLLSILRNHTELLPFQSVSIGCQALDDVVHIIPLEIMEEDWNVAVVLLLLTNVQVA